MEMFNTPAGGKEFKSMEIKSSKKDIQTMPMAPGGRPMPPGQNPPTKPAPPTDNKPADKK